MDRQEFQTLMGAAYERLVELNTKKGHDYAGDEDALSNFKDMGDMLGLDPLLIWAVYAGKHWSAIMTYCREGKVDSEGIDERILDLALYAFLLLGLASEKDKSIEMKYLGATP